jgi:membrane protein YqaA with SNARE-associated domain
MYGSTCAIHPVTLTVTICTFYTVFLMFQICFVSIIITKITEACYVVASGLLGCYAVWSLALVSTFRTDIMPTPLVLKTFHLLPKRLLRPRRLQRAASQKIARFITVFTRAHHWCTRIQSTASIPISLLLVFMSLFYHLCPCVSSGPFASDFINEILYTLLPRTLMFRLFHHPSFDNSNNICWRVKITKLFIM